MVQATENRNLPTAAELFIEVPLYEEIPFSINDVDELREIHNFFLEDKTFDCYCIDCQKPSVFSGVKPEMVLYGFGGTDNYYWTNERVIEDHITSFKVSCSRDKNHQYICFVMISDWKIIKIGQYPSIADIAKADIQKYRKVLKETFGEFSRGIGLAAHGIGIGSFIYLRRTFEKLICEAHDKVEKETGWNEEQYQKSRMDEKIVLLRTHLPPFLVENRTLYSILSKGIHDLSEQECLGAFPIVKLGIEMILDEKIREQKRQAKEAEAKKAIAKLTGELKR
jgi:hypothetical protein